MQIFFTLKDRLTASEDAGLVTAMCRPALTKGLAGSLPATN
jgi:hypothetical protein